MFLRGNEHTYLQDGPLPVIIGVVTPIVITPIDGLINHFPCGSNPYRWRYGPLITGDGAHFVDPSVAPDLSACA